MDVDVKYLDHNDRVLYHCRIGVIPNKGDGVRIPGELQYRRVRSILHDYEKYRAVGLVVWISLSEQGG